MADNKPMAGKPNDIAGGHKGKQKTSKPKSVSTENQAIMKEVFDALKPNSTPQSSKQVESLELSDEEAKQVIDAVEPLIQQNKKASARSRPKNIKSKSINLYNDQPLQVTLENGVVMKLSFSNPQ